jgi:hypothetical protein
MSLIIPMWARWAAGAAGVALVIFLIFSAGVKHEKAAEAKRVAAATKIVKKVEKQAETITAKAEEKTAARLVEIRTVTKTLTKEIPVYVTAQADRTVVLPAGLIRLHDQAALGVSEIPDAPGFVPDAPSGVAPSDFARTIVGNYGTAYEWREAALACRSWVSEQAANFNANIRTQAAP